MTCDCQARLEPFFVSQYGVRPRAGRNNSEVSRGRGSRRGWSEYQRACTRPCRAGKCREIKTALSRHQVRHISLGQSVYQCSMPLRLLRIAACLLHGRRAYPCPVPHCCCRRDSLHNRSIFSATPLGMSRVQHWNRRLAPEDSHATKP